jgi:hypothetical protein
MRKGYRRWSLILGAMTMLTVLPLRTSMRGVAWADEEQEGAHARPTLLRPGGIVLFNVGSGPMSSIFPTPSELPKQAKVLGEVRGVGCQQGIFIPLQLSLRPQGASSAWGNAGFQKAIAQIRQQDSRVDGIFDVKVDRHIFSVLGIYQRACTEILARGFTNPN